MSKKHPGRDTDYAKWTSIMRKLNNELKREHEEERKKSHDMNPRNWKKKKREEEDDYE